MNCGCYFYTEHVDSLQGYQHIRVLSVHVPALNSSTNKDVHRVHLREFYCIYCAEDCSPATSEQRGRSPPHSFRHLGCRHGPQAHTGAPWGPQGSGKQGSASLTCLPGRQKPALTNKPSLQPSLSPAAGAFGAVVASVSCDSTKLLTPASFPASEKDASWRYQEHCCTEMVLACRQPHPNLLITQVTPSPGACAGLPFSKVSRDTRPSGCDVSSASSRKGLPAQGHTRCERNVFSDIPSQGFEVSQRN